MKDKKGGNVDFTLSASGTNPMPQFPLSHLRCDALGPSLGHSDLSRLAFREYLNH